MHVHKYQWSEAFDHLDKEKSGALSLSNELRGLVALDSQTRSSWRKRL